MLTNKKHKLSCKVWIEYKDKPLIGKGGAEILEAIDKENSISKAAETLGMSYRMFGIICMIFKRRWRSR